MSEVTAGNPAPASAKAGPTTINTVKMDDGTTVDFPGSRRLQKTATGESGKTVTVRLDFSNGETRTCKLPASLLEKAAAHGLSQKLGDQISGVKDLDDAVVAIDELVDRIQGGDWNDNTPSGTGMAGASILMKAMIEVSGKTPEEVKAWLGGLDPKQKAAMREHASVKPIVQKLEAEKAAKAAAKGGKAAGPTIDTSALFDSLKTGAKPANSVFAQGPGVVKETERGSPTTQPAATVGNPSAGKTPVPAPGAKPGDPTAKTAAGVPAGKK